MRMGCVVAGAIGLSSAWSASAVAQTAPRDIENPFVQATYCDAAARAAGRNRDALDWSTVAYALYYSAYAEGHEDLFGSPPPIEPSVVEDHAEECAALLPDRLAGVSALVDAAGPRADTVGPAVVEDSRTPEQQTHDLLLDSDLAALDEVDRLETARCFALTAMIGRGLEAEPAFFGFTPGGDALVAKKDEVWALYEDTEFEASFIFDSIEQLETAADQAWIEIDAEVRAVRGSEARRDALFAMYDHCRSRLAPDAAPQ